MRILFFIFSSVIIVGACSNPKEERKSENAIADYKELGDSISSLSQQTLLMNVGREMSSGGPASTIDFCNIHASPLIDSLSKAHKVIISRISERYRNPSNKPSGAELSILKSLRSAKTMDTVVLTDQGAKYYKSISVGMPTCLKCHGVLGKDIDKETASTIRKHYPKDLATGYQFGDFRGAWKIEFE